MPWEAVIGLEIHVQVATKSKLFCHCSTEFGNQPNSQICPICSGMPGVLPVLNKEVVERAIKLGLATNCEIVEVNEFSRKNYFYPDLPKGYQISQFDKPICANGHLNITVKNKSVIVGITRIHMEEDAGKLIHAGSENIKGSTYSLSDLNRACVPLLEIVSEPEIKSAEEARIYMETMRQIIQYLDIGDGNLEEGSLRCDANISIRQKGDPELGTKTEVKNLNSFKAVEKAINIEIDRQIDILEDGGTIIQETRHYNEASNSTKSLRSKEEAHDYRYFPAPDLVPIVIDKSWIERVRKHLPELPKDKEERFASQYNLSNYDANVIVQDKFTADFFEQTVKFVNKPKIVINWLMGDILAYLNNNNISLKNTKLTPHHLGQLLDLISSSKISGKIGKQILPDLMKHDKNPEEIVKEKGLIQVSDEGAIKKIVEEVIAENPKAVEDIKAGKTQTIGFLVGQTMKKSQGKANPPMVNKLLKEILGI